MNPENGDLKHMLEVSQELPEWWKQKGIEGRRGSFSEWRQKMDRLGEPKELRNLHEVIETLTRCEIKEFKFEF